MLHGLKSNITFWITAKWLHLLDFPASLSKYKKKVNKLGEKCGLTVYTTLTNQTGSKWPRCLLSYGTHRFPHHCWKLIMCILQIQNKFFHIAIYKTDN